MKKNSLCVGLFFAASLAFGRAGGGGGYSGGGGHSSGGSYSSHSSGSSYSSRSGSDSSGGGADISDFFILYFRMVRRRPLVGVPLTLFLLYIAFKLLAQSGESGMYSAITQATEKQDRARMAENLSALKSRDPDFDVGAFLLRSQAAFRKIQEAWSGQEMSAARAFISDGVMERFSIQIGLQKADKLRNTMEQVQVLSADILEIESDKHFDTLHVRVSASAVDSEVSLEDGKVLKGSGEPETFAEIWAFLRRPGAKTLKKPGLIEGYCPSCGAALAIADAARCGSCASWVNSGEYDWVLSEITQECEWAVRNGGESVPGFSILADQDPALNTQFLEDRASVAFWRWQACLSEKSAAALRCAATEELCRKVEAEAQAKHTYYMNAAVGAVEVLALEPGETLDRAHVQVKWSGDWHEQGELKENVVRQNVFILARKSGAATDLRSGLRSARCAACGAPPASRDDFKCAYCGAAFNDGSRHWVASEIVPIGLWNRPSVPGAGAPELDLDWTEGLSPAETLAVLIAAMMADGQLDPKEQHYLTAYAYKNDVPEPMVNGLIEAARKGELGVPRPKTPAEAEACLKGLIRMSLADGKIQEEEMNVMLGYAKAFNLQEPQLRAMIKEERLALYKDAKKTLKA